MATTTNFGWETPDDTDLVKDGALAIRTLGSAIDTSLVDLKGGTTGQVLSKTSNTDMDFTWVAQDDSNAIQNAIVDAKGDLITATAADTPARLAVGANDLFLIAASGEATGLKYGGGYTTWTPTWTNLTLGNGSQTARYCQHAKTIFFWLKLEWGSTTSISGEPKFTYPVSASNADAGAAAQIQFSYTDTGVQFYMGQSHPAVNSQTNARLNVGNASGSYLTPTSVNTTVPFTWGTGDVIWITGNYEVA